MKVTVLKRYGFFSVLAAIIRKNSDKRPWIENGEKALPFIHQLDRVARKASDVSAADWRYQTQVKKYRFFFTCVVTAFQTFLEGEKTNKKKRKTEVTYSVALVLRFLAAENENRQLEDLPLADFGRLPDRLLLSVRTKSINENFVN